MCCIRSSNQQVVSESSAEIEFIKTNRSSNARFCASMMLILETEIAFRRRNEDLGIGVSACESSWLSKSKRPWFSNNVLICDRTVASFRSVGLNCIRSHWK